MEVGHPNRITFSYKTDSIRKPEFGTRLFTHTRTHIPQGCRRTMILFRSQACEVCLSRPSDSQVWLLYQGSVWDSPPLPDEQHDVSVFSYWENFSACSEYCLQTEACSPYLASNPAAHPLSLPTKKITSMCEITFCSSQMNSQTP